MSKLLHIFGYFQQKIVHHCGHTLGQFCDQNNFFKHMKPNGDGTKKRIITYIQVHFFPDWYDPLLVVSFIPLVFAIIFRCSFMWSYDYYAVRLKECSFSYLKYRTRWLQRFPLVSQLVLIIKQKLRLVTPAQAMSLATQSAIKIAFKVRLRTFLSLSLLMNSEFTCLTNSMKIHETKIADTPVSYGFAFEGRL